MSNKRGPYSSPRQQQRRMRILAAASEQLERHGLSALTMQCIAEVGDVSTKTLYNLFGSRDQLLLEAASQHLSDLEHSPAVVEVEEGIPRLLAFMFGAIRQFEDMPLLSRAVIAILLRREAEPEEAYARLGRGQRFAHTALEVALDRGELLPAIDLEQLSYLIAANQWGAVLLWEKGLLGLKQLEQQVQLGHYLSLIPACRGRRKRALQEQLDQLLCTRAADRGPAARQGARVARLGK